MGEGERGQLLEKMLQWERVNEGACVGSSCCWGPFDVAEGVEPGQRLGRVGEQGLAEHRVWRWFINQ